MTWHPLLKKSLPQETSLFLPRLPKQNAEELIQKFLFYLCPIGNAPPEVQRRVDICLLSGPFLARLMLTDLVGLSQHHGQGKVSELEKA